MVIFGLILALVGFLGVCVFTAPVILGVKPFVLWVILLVISALISMTGVGLIANFKEQPSEKIIQIEKNHNQYNYCPYCGEEIK